MIEQFPGYYKKAEVKLKGMWGNGILVFDTNVLLNLYRYSDSTKNTLLDLIGKFSDRIWLPHQAALEYNRNRYEVIAEQEKAYKEFTENILKIQKDLQSTSKPPFLSKEVDDNLNKVFGLVNTEVLDSITKYCGYLSFDPIYEKLSELFANRISEPYSDEKLTEIYKEGEERYKNKMPPGFEDEKNKEGNRKFGDLILWKQVIDKARELNKDIILITDERKIDWWWKIKDGRIMGPRQELIQEIKDNANVDFHMYSSEQFLRYGLSFLEEQIDQKALEEIKAMKKAENEKMRIIEKLRLNNEIKHIQISKDVNYLEEKINKINDEIFIIENDSNQTFDSSIGGVESDHYINIMNYKKRLQDEKEFYLRRANIAKKSQTINDENRIKIWWSDSAESSNFNNENEEK